MKTLFVGQRIIRLSSVDSTNNYTSELVRQSVIHEGAVITAEEQYAGKGQRSRVWNSASGQNLLMSVYLKPTFLGADEQFYLTKLISVAVKKVLDEFIPGRVKIKWPNDILVGDDKIAGILIENTLKSTQISRSVVGIGLNVNQTDFGDLRKVTSLKAETGLYHPLDYLLEKLCIQIESLYFKLKENKKALNDVYLESLYRKGENALFDNNGEEEEFEVVGVQSGGELVLKNSEGVETPFAFHEIRFIR